jgi:hypothetical protein
MSDKMSIDQKEPSQENTPAESKASSPDHEHSPSAPSQEAQPAKRKGGRKPVSHGRPLGFVLSRQCSCPPVLTLTQHDDIGSGAAKDYVLTGAP